MTVELTVLALAAILAFVQLILFAIPANKEIGTDYLAGPRDGGVTIKGKVTGRLQRAYNNHIEGLVLYTAATVAVTAGENSSIFTNICALAYLGARIVYVPAYALGWNPGRSIIWLVGFVATFLMLLAALLT
jgi:uncharacterized MAPEG superfamily protein